MNATSQHIPVLLDECLEVLAPSLVSDEALVVDGTLGLGGHSEAVLTRFPNVTVVGIDRDRSALDHASTRLERFGERFIPFLDTYDQIPRAIAVAGRESAEGILLDVGVSSMQIDQADRGFAYAVDAPLDMRMDQSSGNTAADVIRDYSEIDLARIFREFGEEKLAARYARAIVTEREHSPITHSGRLVSILTDATPYSLRQQRHPAKRVFQALRIEVNGELEILSRAVNVALDALAMGGRLLVLSYHSLEDRIVKTAFTRVSTSSAPADLPVVPSSLRPRFRLVFNGARKASAAEVARNPRASSVRFRAIERIEVAA